MTRGSQTIRLGPVGPRRGRRSRVRVRDRSRLVGRDDARVGSSQPERDETGDPGAQRPDPERAAQPEQLDEDEPREQRADDRAHRVGRVQAAERLAEGRRCA